MAKQRQTRSEAGQGELTLAEIAMAVEGGFGPGSVGLVGSTSGIATDEARSAFVKMALHLVVIQRVEGCCVSPDKTWELRRKAMRDVRGELASMLGIDVNEVFRLHHHADGLKAKDRSYREKARGIEWGLAKEYRLGA